MLLPFGELLKRALQFEGGASVEAAHLSVVVVINKSVHIVVIIFNVVVVHTLLPLPPLYRKYKHT